MGIILGGFSVSNFRLCFVAVHSPSFETSWILYVYKREAILFSVSLMFLKVITYIVPFFWFSNSFSREKKGAYWSGRLHRIRSSALKTPSHILIFYDTRHNTPWGSLWSLHPLQISSFMLFVNDRLCGLVVGVPGYRKEMYCVCCEVRTEFIYVM
jgi:hypothetical protein